jgi:alpha-ketoglutarate-dependent taurine dioxygenase
MTTTLKSRQSLVPTHALKLTIPTLRDEGFWGSVLASNPPALYIPNYLSPDTSAALAAEHLVREFQPLGLVPHTHEPESFVWDIQAKPIHSCVEQTTFSSHANEAELHTDSGYRLLPEKWMALYCVRPARCGGGVNYLLNSQTALLSLPKDIQQTLQQALFPIRIPDAFLLPGQANYVEAPLLQTNPWQIRYRYDTLVRGLDDRQIPLSDPRRQVLETLRSHLKHVPAERIDLQAGDLIIVNNHLSLHARTAFTDHQRHLLRIRFSCSNV